MSRKRLLGSVAVVAVPAIAGGTAVTLTTAGDDRDEAGLLVDAGELEPGEDVVIIDARAPEEHDEGAIPGRSPSTPRS